MMKTVDSELMTTSSDSTAPTDSRPGGSAVSAGALRILAYVHLRNIHNSTGAGRVARQLTSHLAERSDVAIEILADRSDYDRIIRQVGAPWNGYRYHFFASETSRQQARWFLTHSPKAQSFWPEAQVVFCTAESYVPKGRAKLAVTVHDAAYFESGAHQWNRAFLQQRWKWHLLYRTLERQADLFHAVSHFSADRLSHFFPSIRSRIRVVHNAVTPHFFGAVAHEGIDYLKQAGLTTRPYLLVPGGLHFRKNADLILEAWPLLKTQQPDLRLVVVNHCNPGYAARMRALDPEAFLAGFVSDEALHALYAGAQAVWFPSRYEGFGLPVVEAMASGAPVVTSNASSLPEIAGSAAILVDPQSAGAHVEALAGLLQDAGLRAELCERGRLRAKQFTWIRAAAEIKRHLESLA